MEKLIGKRIKMQYTYTIKSKRGIAMIELIFALMIIGITLMSAPMLIQQTISSNSVALQQEAIAIGAAHTTVILSTSWDEKNSDGDIGVSPILDSNRTGITPNPLDFNNGIVAGLIEVVGRRTFYQLLTLPASAPSNFGVNKDINETDFSKFDDVDDFDDSDLGITIYNTENSSADVGDYVDVNLNMHTTITYSEDRPLDTSLIAGKLAPNVNIGGRITETALATSSNIKFITMNLTTNSTASELDKNITIKAFSCNIGTYEPQGEDQK